MQLLRESEVAAGGRTVTFRASRLSSLVGLFFCLILFAMLPWIVWQGIVGSSWFGLIIAIVIGIPMLLIFLLVFSSMWRAWLASFRPQNWLLIVSPEAVYAKLRSHLNFHFDSQDQTVVRFDRSEIVAAGQLLEDVRTADLRGNVSIQVQRSLEIALASEVDLAPLIEAVTAERQREGPPERSPLGYTSRQKSHHYPVTVIPERHAVRIEWRGKRMLRALAHRGIRIAARRRIRLPRAGESLEALETQLLELLERGKYLGAVRVARRAYGYSLAEAKRFVDELNATPPA